MPITIEMMDGEGAGQKLAFDDNIETIVIGRDPERCQVVLPPDQRMVGREHCTISRLRGQYYVEMGPDRRVTMNGNLMETTQVLPDSSVLQIGPDGPRLSVVCSRSESLAATFQQGLDEDIVRQRAAAPANVEQVAAVASRAERSGNIANVAIGIAVLILAVGGGLFFLLRGDIDEIENSQASTSQSVEDMQDDLAEMGDDLSTLGAGMSEALQSAAESTFLVMRQDSDGSLIPFGTAWTFAPGQLATNAHVAEHFDDLEPGQSILVRASGGARSFVVTGVTVHPGFGAFSDLWQDYVPVQASAMEKADPVRAAGMAADVGLLMVAMESDLGPALTIASSDVQEKLRAGDPVGYVGYPVEAMALGGVNVETPVPQTQIGYVTAVTDYFNSPSDPSESLLIQHSLPATGGASGSPLLNASGEVVGLLSAVNFIVVGGERIPSAIDVNFAQRATLLGELQSEELQSLQQARTDGWSSEINRLYASGRLANRSAEIADVVSAWEQMVAVRTNDYVSGSTVVEDEFFPLDSLHIDGFAMGSGDALGAQLYGREVEMKIEADQQYLLAVEGSDGEVEAKLVGDGYQIVDVMDIKPRLKAIAFKASRSGTIKARIGSTERSGTLGYELRSATVAPKTPESVASAAVDRWLKDLARSGGGSRQASRVRQWSGSVGDRFAGGFQAAQKIELTSAGQWLVMAICPQFRDINLELRKMDGTVMAVDEQPDWYPFIAIDARESMTLEAVVATIDEGCDYRIFLYRAE